MTPLRPIAVLWLALGATTLAACQAHRDPVGAPASTATPASAASLEADLDAIFADPVLSQALLAARVVSLRDDRVLYSRHADRRVIPASNMKIVTVATTAARLGWDYRFVTRLEQAGTRTGSVLHGDLIVTGSGDPSIAARDLRTAPLFEEWAETLHAAGLRRIDGRLIGDDGAFDDQGLGDGWAWHYLADGYAAPSGALSYNENVAVLRIAPGTAVGLPAGLELGPPGHGLIAHDAIVTGPPGSAASVTLTRLPGDANLTVRGSVPVDAGTIVRTASVDDPTQFFVEALRLALADRGITVTGGARDIDDLPDAPSPGARTTIATHESLPLSSLAAYDMKVSQNVYAEMFLKALGRADAGTGSAETGRQAARRILEGWGLPVDALVMFDGSGLSRYDYASADLIVGILAHVWRDANLRGPFVASLPVAGHDGTLESRMRDTPLDRRVQAKTGTMFNVRSLSGYMETARGEKLAFSFIANHFVAPSASVDAIVERALERLAR